MRFLLLNQFFAPDPAPTGQLLAGLAGFLAASGHEVTVVCARSTYGVPDADHLGDSRQPLRSEATDACSPRANGTHTSACETRFGEFGPPSSVSVRRVWTPRFSHGVAGRLLAYAPFCSGAFWHALCGPCPDVILTMTTPPLLSLTGSLARKLRGARHFIWEMDVYPDVAVSLGVFRSGGIAHRLAGALALWSRRNADGIIALGPCMRDLLVEGGAPPARVHVAENWADPARIVPAARVDDGCLELLYAGNLGLAHDLDTVASAALRLACDTRFRFVFSGGGPLRPSLEKRCGHLPNVSVSGYVPEEAMSEHLAACDAGLVTQNPATLGTVVPSKLYALMAAARPVIFIGPAASTAALVIERFGCGWQVDPGDVNGLIALLELLAAKPGLMAEAGRRARAAFLEHYTLSAGVARIAFILGAARAASRDVAVTAAS